MHEDAVRVWRIAADTPDYVAEDLSGEGAKATGGRWNRPDVPMLYAASSRALACLEAVVHLGAGALPLNRFLVEIQIPRNVWRDGTDVTPSLVGWDALPAGKVSLDWGCRWVDRREQLVARVPSIVVPEEHCVLINPLHPGISQLSARKVRRWTYDARLKSQT